MKVLAVLALLAAAPAYGQGFEPSPLDAVRGMAPEAAGARGVLPAKVDFSGALPPPGAQGPTDTCVSWAVTYAAGSLAARKAAPGVVLSPAYTYALSGGGPFCRGGTDIPKTLETLRMHGALPRGEYAVDPGWCGRAPSARERARAVAYRIGGWSWIDARDVGQVKAVLAQRRPVVFGMPVGPVFAALKGDGTFNAAERGDTFGHAMVLVGFDDERQAFRLMNSYGRAWGDKGYAWLGYDAWVQQVSIGYVIDAP